MSMQSLCTVHRLFVNSKVITVIQRSSCKWRSIWHVQLVQCLLDGKDTALYVVMLEVSEPGCVDADTHSVLLN